MGHENYQKICGMKLPDRILGGKLPRNLGIEIETSNMMGQHQLHWYGHILQQDATHVKEVLSITIN